MYAGIILGLVLIFVALISSEDINSLENVFKTQVRVPGGHQNAMGPKTRFLVSGLQNIPNS